ncbi:MAG: molybdenum cofactor guanylyltransferase [Pseudomonadota bacterium]|jgi:molybdenum cofactor guanylyltransferase
MLMKNLISGVVLAGGKAQRMGGQDKGLCRIRTKFLIEYAIAGLRPQVSQLFVNANRNQAQYAALCDCPVIADQDCGDFSGPLAGIASGLRAASTDYVVFVPCDAPVIHSELVMRLYQALRATQADISVAHDGAHLQPTFALVARRVLPTLESALNAGERKIYQFYQQHHFITVDFSASPEMFLNLNTPEQLLSFAQQLSV